MGEIVSPRRAKALREKNLEGSSGIDVVWPERGQALIFGTVRLM